MNGRTMTMRHLGGVAAVLVAVLAPSVQAGEPRVDPRADALVRRMSDLLGHARTIRFEATEVRTRTAADGVTVTQRLARRVRVRRPDAFRQRIRSKDRDQVIWLEAGSLTFQSNRQRAYAQVSVPATIDDAVAYLTAQLAVPMPLGPLLHSSPHTALIAADTTARALGVATIDHDKCRHVTLRREAIDQDIWIHEGDRPLPCRLRVVYKRLPGRPIRDLTFYDWELDVRLARDTFRFVPPPNFPRIRIIERTSGAAAPAADASRGGAREGERGSDAPIEGSEIKVHENGDVWEASVASVAPSAIVGTLVATLPSGAQNVSVGDTVYYQHGHHYYERVYYGGDVLYQAVSPPIGAVVPTLPPDCRMAKPAADATDRVCDGVRYLPVEGGYRVVETP
jgi:hypothetical protein